MKYEVLCQFSKINNYINPLASPGAGALGLKYGYVNTVTPSPNEVKGLRNNSRKNS